MRQSRIGWQLCASRVLRDNACSRSTNPRPSKLVALGLSPKAAKATFVELHSAKSRQNYSRRSRYSQNGIDTARCSRCVIHAVGERS